MRSQTTAQTVAHQPREQTLSDTITDQLLPKSHPNLFEAVLGAPVASNIAATTATITLPTAFPDVAGDVNSGGTAFGTVSWVLQEANRQPPSPAQVFKGLDSNGEAPADSNLIVAAAPNTVIALTGLTAGTQYALYAVWYPGSVELADARLSDVVGVAFDTP